MTLTRLPDTSALSAFFPDLKLPEIELHDSLSRRKLTFEPGVPGKVGMYLCGPTVYSDAHLGHAKKEVAFDVIRRYLAHRGYAVRYVSNITDVGHLQNDSDDGEDKMLARAALERLEPIEVAEKYYWSFMDDMARLGVQRPSIQPRATGHIPEQIELIEELIARGHAYEANGSVYFGVRSWPEYGKLSGRKLDDQEEGTREAVRFDKRDPRDFALWKRAEAGHIMRWQSPWGVGFPGWHIECSAMSLKYLGESFDIHGGGLDLEFPHHEAEIAQAEAAGHPFARYWMHNNMLTIGGEKMSKSKGNFTTLIDLFKRVDPQIVRFLLVGSHYRSVTEFSEEGFVSAHSGYRRLHDALNEIGRRLPGAPEKANDPLLAQVRTHVTAFEAAMSDDFNTPRAVAALFNLTTEVNAALAGEPGREALEAARAAYLDLGGAVLGLFTAGAVSNTGAVTGQDDTALVGTLMDVVLEARQHYRLSKQYAASDALRGKLADVGVTVEDTRDGARWKR